MCADDSLRNAPLLQVADAHRPEDADEEHAVQLGHADAGEACDAHDRGRARCDEPEGEGLREARGSIERPSAC